MKTLTLTLLGCLLALSGLGQKTPLYNAFLQNNANGNQFGWTNLADLGFPTNAAFATAAASATNGAGMALPGTNGSWVVITSSLGSTNQNYYVFGSNGVLTASSFSGTVSDTNVFKLNAASNVTAASSTQYLNNTTNSGWMAVGGNETNSGNLVVTNGGQFIGNGGGLSNLTLIPLQINYNPAATTTLNAGTNNSIPFFSSVSWGAANLGEGSITLPSSGANIVGVGFSCYGLPLNSNVTFYFGTNSVISSCGVTLTGKGTSAGCMGTNFFGSCYITNLESCTCFASNASGGSIGGLSISGGFLLQTK